MIVVIFPDTGERYLSSLMFHDAAHGMTAEERAFVELVAAQLARAREGMSAPVSLQGKLALLARVGRDIADSG